MTAQQREPFGKRLYYSKAVINEICRRALQETKCMPGTPQPVEIDLFVERRFGCRLVYSDLGADVLGLTAFDSRGKVQMIEVSRALFDAGEVGRRRAWTTIAHEAGHGLLHGGLFTSKIHQHVLFEGHVDREQRRILCRESDFRNRSGTYDGRWWEWQANQAIGGLLLPGALVLECVRSFLKPAGRLEAVKTLPRPIPEAAVQCVAATFEVNPVVARIRLSELFPETEQPTL